MSAARYNLVMKTVLFMLPATAFLATYLVYDIYIATIVLIGSLYAALFVHWLMTRELQKIHLVGVIAATVLGGLTLVLRDPVFIKLKPTAVFGVIALVLAGSHFVGAKPLMARVPSSFIDLPQPLWHKINASWACFYAFLGALNLAVAYGMTEHTWVMIKTFGYSALTFLFILAHIPFVYDHLPKDPPPAANDEGAPSA